MNKEKSEQYLNIFIEVLEEYTTTYDSLMAHLASRLDYEKINIDDFAEWVRANPDVLSTLHFNSKKYKMIRKWQDSHFQSVSIEEFF